METTRTTRAEYYEAYRLLRMAKGGNLGLHISHLGVIAGYTLIICNCAGMDAAVRVMELRTPILRSNGEFTVTASS